MKKLILKHYQNAIQDQIDRGMSWYFEANKKAQNLAKQFDLTIEQTSAIIAILSPGTKWEINLKDAEKLCKLKKRASVTTYRANKEKALRIIENKEPVDNIIAPSRYGRKVYAFYDNICYPDASEQVTIDRWIIRALCLNNKERSVFESSLYDRVADQFKEVAKEIGILPHQLQAIVWIVKKESEE